MIVAEELNARVAAGPDLDPVVVTRVRIPGAGVLEFERDRATSALLGVRGGGRRYLEVRPDGEWVWPGMCRWTERADSDGVTRTVTTPRETWTETYRWIDHRLVEVDGVEIRRDEKGRVIACVPGGTDPAPAEHRWFYGYSEQGLVHIDGPFGMRSVTLDREGRVRAVHDGGVTRSVEVGRDGQRSAPGRPLFDHIDEAGRCWAMVDARGVVERVYVWDGARCLARIDGHAGAPLGAVFCLDPSATPVRVVEPDRVVRVPRDAYGEALLALRDVPGLFGGQVHGGLVHLPLRRLDPLTGSFCEPDPYDGGDADPRRRGTYEGPLPAEPAPCSAYEVCRGDPVGRADPTGGISAGLIISDLTWSFQNNLLTFFGVDWWFNLFMSLIMAPFKGLMSPPMVYDFFDSTGLVASERHGGFGVRRDGFIPGLITKASGSPRAFTTQHIVWAPDVEFAALDRGEVIDCGAAPVEFTHYGSILSIAPAGRPRSLLQSMRLDGRQWVSNTALPSWTRHGGVGVPVAPGTVTPWFPSGGIHPDTSRMDTRGDLSCPVAELVPATVAAGDLEDRSFLTAPSVTGLAAGDRVLVADGTNLAAATVIGVVMVGTAQRVQLDADLAGLAQTNLTMTKMSATPVSSESRGAGAVANSIDVHGTAQTYATNDLLRLVSGTDVTIARIARIEAQIPIDRPLPTGLTGPISLTRGVVGAAAVTVTMAGANIDFGSAARPAPGTVGLVAGGGTEVAVRIESHAGTNEAVLDIALPAPVTSAASITFRPINAGTVLGSRDGGAEATAVITYTPTVAGGAPDVTAGSTLVVRCDAGPIAHARIVTGAPVHDVAVLDRAIAGTAPFTVERFTTEGGSIGAVNRSDVMALVLPDPAPFAAAPAVFLTRVDGDPPTAATALVTGDVAGGVLRVTPPTTVAVGFEPGRPVLVGARLAAVRTVKITPTFDRPIDLAASGLKLVRLEANGHAYLGEVTGASEVLAQPQISVGAANVDVPFPRFVRGDLVNIADRATGADTWHRVDAVSGGRLTLVGGPTLTPGDLVRVSAVATRDPGVGGPFLGLAGTRTGSGPTTTATFEVWSTDACPNNRVVGIVDGTVTHPAVVTNADQAVEITFSETFDAPGATVSTLTRQADRFVSTLARDGGALLLDGAAGTLATSAGQSIVAVAYAPGSVSVTGTIGPGSFLVPEGEGTEVTRTQGLIDHELEHTIQYAQWGPLWFNIFPMLAMELPGILATDTELPEYSAFLDATVAAGTGSRWDITIPSRSGVTIETDNELQVVQGSQRKLVKVVAISGTVYSVTVDGGGALPTGQVSVRKKQKASVFDGFYAFFDLLTHGGLLNLVAGSTWGGIFWLIGKGFYGLGRAIFGTGDLFAASVQSGGGALTLSNEADTTHIRTEGRIIVRQGDNSVVRSMTRSATTITLTENVAFTGDVRVAMYDTHDPDNAFDWYDYYPAAVDADNPFSITLEPPSAGASTPTFGAEDRVTIKYRNTNFNTDVMSVSGTTVELSDPITIVDGERSLRIAKIGASDPLGNADSAAMVEMGMGWMKWIFDPYGQIEYAVAPREDWARNLLRVMRWLLGTQNFSLLPFGYVWWFRLFGIQKEHTAFIEQQASQESGDLYSPLARLYGQRDDDGWAKYKMVVGDVARYRYWPLDRNANFVPDGRLDRTSLPGDTPDNYGSDLRILPNLDTTGTDDGPPNLTAQVGSAADPGTFVAERFTVRDTDPRPVPGGDRLGFETSLLGNVPVGRRVQKMLSSYVAFTRPGTHRVTTENGIFGDQQALDAHNVGAQHVFAGGQTLFYDVTVSDVTVTVAGRTVDLSTPGTSDRVTMVPFQSATVAVTPNTSRSYALIVPDPAGSLLRAEADTRLAAQAVAGGPVPVEVSRFYACTNGSYPPGGLAFAGMHLSRDVHIPVRRFSVDVVTTLPLRATADPAAAPITTVARDTDAFVLVPAPIARALEVTTVAGAPPAAGAADPITRIDTPAAASGFVGVSGAVFRVRFPASAPTGAVVLTVRVGTGATTADLTCSFDLT